MEIASSPTTTTAAGNSTTERSVNVQQSLLIFKLICFGFISIVGLIGNTTIFTTLLRHRRKSSEYFILNLAITDLLVCAVGIPLDMYVQIDGDIWPYGGFLCRIIYPFQTLLVLTSIMTLTGMSLERYRAITTPLKPLLGKSMLLATIAGIWCIGIAVVAPYVKNLTLTSKGHCEENWPEPNQSHYYTVALFIIDYCIPLTIITYCYSRAGYQLYRNDQEFKLNDCSTSYAQNIASKKRHRRNKKAIKVFSLAVLVFVVCMLPGDAYWMWHSFGNGSSFAHENSLQTFTNILVYANSAINPFIFGVCRMACFRKFCLCRRVRRTFSTFHFRRALVRRLESWDQTSDLTKGSLNEPSRETKV